MKLIIRKNLVILKALVRREIAKSFHKSILGVLWHVIIPFLQLLIFYSVYSAINQKDDLLATISGLFLWFLFNNAILPSIQQMIGAKGLITNLKIPAYLIPASGLTMSMIFTFLFVLSSTVVIFFSHSVINSGLIVGIPIVILFLFFTYSIALIVSIGNIFFRDIGMLWNSFSFLLFLTAPILYPIKILPGPLMIVARLNPITQFINALRICVSNDAALAFQSVAWLNVLSISFISFLIAIWVYIVSRKNIIANI